MHSQRLAVAFDSRRPLLESLASELEQQTRDALSGVSHLDRIYYRTKGKESFLEKALDEKYTNPLLEIEDQVAGRVLTLFRDDLSVVTEKLCDWFGPVEASKKQPTSVSEFGYESNHLVFVIPEHGKPDGWSDILDMPSTFEMQVRTLFMHAWAEPQHNLGYKGRPMDTKTKRELAWVAASSWGADRIMNEIYRSESL